MAHSNMIYDTLLYLFKMVIFHSYTLNNIYSDQTRTRKDLKQKVSLGPWPGHTRPDSQVPPLVHPAELHAIEATPQ